MNTRFDKETGKLKSRLIYLGSKVEENLVNAVDSVMERDGNKAEKVVQNDEEIDTLEVDLEEECLKVLALYQPVASDLRLVVAILKMNNDLERIGDLAGNIAKNAIFLSKHKQTPIPFDFYKMANQAIIMLKNALSSLTKTSIELAYEIIDMDDYLDNINNKMYSIVEKVIRENPEDLELYIHMASISRALERIGDLAVNMAEDIIYLYEGKIIRHSSHLNKS